MPKSSPKVPFVSLASVRKANAMLMAGIAPAPWPANVQRPTREDMRRASQQAMRDYNARK